MGGMIDFLKRSCLFKCYRCMLWGKSVSQVNARPGRSLRAFDPAQEQYSDTWESIYMLERRCLVHRKACRN